MIRPDHGPRLSKTEHDILLALCGASCATITADAQSEALLRRTGGVSRENVNYPQADGTVCKTRTLDAEGGLKLDCSGGLGAAMHVTATFGMVAAARVIERLLDAKGKD